MGKVTVYNCIRIAVKVSVLVPFRDPRNSDLLTYCGQGNSDLMTYRGQRNSVQLT